MAHFDLLVLGGGSGGIASAVRAASYGAKVAVIEARNLGGTCVNFGCVPKKVMFNAANMAEMFVKSVDYGFAPEPVRLEWNTLIEKRNNYIKKLRDIYANKLDHHNITRVVGKGIFLDEHTLEVDGKKYQANHIIIATGGKPVLPTDMVGVEHAIDSDGFFQLPKQPEKVAIIGGGYIGVELAGILHGLGTKTHLLLRGDYPLSRFDETLGKTLLEIMWQKGLQVHPNYQASHIKLQENGQKTLICSNGVEINDLDAVILAIGRAPQTLHLNLENLSVQMDKRGLIQVDAYQNTTVNGLYAIGDVTNAPALTPVSIAAGRRLADRLFGNQPKACLDYTNICSVVFTHPPVSSVGLSEAVALEKFGKNDLHIYQTRFIPMLDVLSEEKIPTVMKLITQGTDETIIGLHMIGYGVDEMLQGFGVAIKMGARKADFDNTVGIHPTSAEELVTLTKQERIL